MTNDPQALEKLQRKGKKPVTDRTDTLELADCPFCGSKIRHVESWAKSFDPPRLFHEWHHADENMECPVRRYIGLIVCSAIDDPKVQETVTKRWNTRAVHAAPQPAGLRCDRCGSSGDTFVLCAGCHSPTTEEAMFMLQDVPGATLVERVARLSKWYLELREFPYQQTFDAIAMAVELWPSKEAAFGISISIRKFQEAFNNHRDADTRSYADRAQSATAFDPELQADGDAERTIIAESNGHHWISAFNLTCCRDCGIVRRADDKNKPCPGVVKVALR